MPRTVLILETYADRYAQELKARFPQLDIVTAKSRSELPVDLSTIDILVAFGISVDDDLLGAATRLEWIQSLATGVDHFLRCASLRPQVLLTSTRGIHGSAMREAVAFMMLSLSHEMPRLMRNQDARQWDRSKRWPLLAGKSAAVIGVGVSSTAIARLLKAFGMHVIGFSRTPREIEGFDDVVHTERLAAAARDVDYLINVLPGDARNAGLVGKSVFAGMKPTAFFINIGRGETVDETALIEALTQGRIAGAALDVFRTHPLPPDSPFWQLENVIVCPHLAGFFAEYEDYAMPILVENMRLFLDGRTGEMRNIVPH